MQDIPAVDLEGQREGRQENVNTLFRQTVLLPDWRDYNVALLPLIGKPEVALSDTLIRHSSISAANTNSAISVIAITAGRATLDCRFSNLISLTNRSGWRLARKEFLMCKDQLLLII
jgi:ABC-type antimicrobial peptide transport system ATPase subunit